MLPLDEGTPEMGSSRSPSEMRKATRKYVVDNGFDSLAMRACVNLRSRRVFNPKGLIKRDKVLDGGSDVLKGVEKVKALGASGVMSGSRVGVVWMEVGGGIVRARVVSRVAVKVV
ncbi:hypothetical protein Tco_1213367 [Tanacetum coccineum]